MRFFVFCLLITCLLAGENPYMAAAYEAHGDRGWDVAEYLVDHMPVEDDGTVPVVDFVENVGLALQARAEFPWAQAVPEDLFLNDVAPYAVFDETREKWRADFLKKARPIVKDTKTASEAAQLLNRDFFNAINVHYNTGRKAPNQSPSESIALGKATCTGLSIILVNACRSVGIPARAVGTPMWANDRGNHTWVEIWDGEWKFLGADEYDEAGLNRGWFVEEAGKAKAGDRKYGIYATSWKGQTHFPMVWARESEVVGAVEVTDRYAKSQPKNERATVEVTITKDGKRIETDVWLLSLFILEIAAEGRTRDERADLNDILALTPTVSEKASYLLIWRDGDVMRSRLEIITVEPKASILVEIDVADGKEFEPSMSSHWLGRPLPNGKSREANGTDWLEIQLLHRSREMAARSAELEAKSIIIDGSELKWLERTFGDAEMGEKSLWISLHGGGGTRPEVNDQQWRNQIGLYQPEEGIYVAPRAPGNTWDLWHRPEVDGLLDRLIENYVLYRGVDPDRVYLLGYSAGGDGVYQLAPRMADRFAAAAMMAGHPNEATVDNLMNLPFAILMGANDSAYDRNKIARERGDQLAKLAEENPGKYKNFIRIYEGLGHWMERKDAEALPWMAQQTRNRWPDEIVWRQDDVTHRSLYWLELPEGHEPKAGDTIRAKIEGRKITLTGDVPKGMRVWVRKAGDYEVIVNQAPLQNVSTHTTVRDAVLAQLRLGWSGAECHLLKMP